MLELKDVNGKTVFYRASGSISLLKYLRSVVDLEHLLKIKSNDGFTPFHGAAVDCADCLDLLISLTNMEIKYIKEGDDAGNTVVHWAAEKNIKSLEVIFKHFKEDFYELIQMPAKNGNTALHLAAGYNEESFKFFFENVPNPEGWLKISGYNNHTPLTIAVIDNSGILEFILQKLSNLNNIVRINEDGWTIFHVAAQANTESLKILIEYFADIEKHLSYKNIDGVTPFHIAAVNNVDSLKVLCEYVKNPTGYLMQKVKDGRNGFEIAREGNPRCFEYLERNYLR